MKSLAFAALLLAAGCGGAPKSTAPARTPTSPKLDADAAVWLPADEDTVYSYETSDLVSGATGVFNLRAKRVGPNRVDLVGSRIPERLVYDRNGIQREREGTYILRTPPTVGLSWPGGPNATFHVARVDVSVKVKAGDFDRCVEVVEERTGAVKGSIATTFCPNVGIVLIETKGTTQDGEIHEKVELRSFSKAVDIGPEGLRKSPPLAGCGKSIPSDCHSVRQGSRSRYAQTRFTTLAATASCPRVVIGSPPK